MDAYWYIDGRECTAAFATSPTGAEIWLYIDRDTGELVAAERLDGEWHDMPLDVAEADYHAEIENARKRLH